MSAEDLERYETEMELQLYREYRDVLPLFSYVVETERRFYLANRVDVRSLDGQDRGPHDPSGRGLPVPLEIELHDAWVWDIYRPGPARFVKSVRVVTFKDVNVEETKTDD